MKTKAQYKSKKKKKKISSMFGSTNSPTSNAKDVVQNFEFLMRTIDTLILAFNSKNRPLMTISDVSIQTSESNGIQISSTVATFKKVSRKECLKMVERGLRTTGTHRYSKKD